MTEPNKIHSDCLPCRAPDAPVEVRMCPACGRRLGAVGGVPTWHLAGTCLACRKVASFHVEQSPDGK